MFGYNRRLKDLERKVQRLERQLYRLQNIACPHEAIEVVALDSPDFTLGFACSKCGQLIDATQIGKEELERRYKQQKKETV